MTQDIKRLRNNLPDLAIYDLHKSYHYKTYWNNRKYEHLAEMFAINGLLNSIEKKGKSLKNSKILDLGAGFGRLSPVYCNKFDTSILGDYSFKELLDAKDYIKKVGCNKNIYFVALNAYFLPFKDNSLDIVLSVRLMHHIEHPQSFLKEVYRVLKPGGFLILEIANKNHIKAIIRAILKLDIKFFSKTKTKVDHNKYSAQGIVDEKQGYIFENYSVNYITKLAQNIGFKTIAYRQVSILRSVLLKKLLHYKILAKLDNLYQKLSVILNYLHIFFTPSVFILFYVSEKGKNHKLVNNIKEYNSNNQADFNALLQCPKHNIRLERSGNKLLCKKGCFYEIKKRILDLRFPPVVV